LTVVIDINFKMNTSLIG